MPGSAPAFIIRPSVRVSVCPCVCVQYCVFADRPPDKLFSTLFSTSEMSSTELRALFRAFIRSSTSNGMSVAARIGAHSARDGGGRVATRSELATSSSLFPHARTLTRTPPPLAGNSFPNYNIREYVRRRAREEFSKEGTGKSLAAIREELDVVRRQGAVYSLYNRGPVVKSVMDLPNM